MYRIFCQSGVLAQNMQCWRKLQIQISSKLIQHIFVEHKIVIWLQHNEPKRYKFGEVIIKDELSTISLKLIFGPFWPCWCCKANNIFSRIYCNVLLHANFTKCMGSICWTQKISMCLSKHISLKFKKNSDL